MFGITAESDDFLQMTSRTWHFGLHTLKAVSWVGGLSVISLQ